jgi:hypothetical protein
MKDQARAEQVVEQAFATVLTTPGHEQEIEARLCAAVRKLAGRRDGAPIDELPPATARVSRDLHTRILDAVEDRQYTTHPARSRLIALGAALLIIAVAGIVQLERTRSEALTASQPTIADAAPKAGAIEVPLDGEFRVLFGRRPIGMPTITHLPPDGKQGAGHWDGSTLLVDYTGLHFGTKYQLVLTAQYSSSLRDTGRFEKRWSFTAEGAPHLVTNIPIDGDTTVSRYGLLAVDFSKRPSVDPVITLSPAGSLGPGFWNGTTWKVQYTDLHPLTKYTAAVTLLPSDPKGHIHSLWSFTTEPGAPPAGVPVVWYSTSSHSDPSYLGVPNRLVAIDWAGRMVGTLYVGTPGPQSPDGSWLSTAERTGAINAAGHQATEQLGGAVWADLGGHFCDVTFSPSTGQMLLQTGAVGGRERVVAQLGPVPASGGPTVVTCGVAADRAVVGDAGTAGVTGVRIYKLSTGQLLYHRRYANDSLMVVSTFDGRYIGESPNGFGSAQPGPGVIRRTSDDAVVARLGSRRVIAFSSDGSLVLTAPALGSSGPVDVQLLNWRTGMVLWRLAGDPQASGQAIYSLAQPNGQSFIVGLANPSGPGDVDGLFLVHADGRAEKIVSGSVFLATYPG